MTELLSGRVLALAAFLLYLRTLAPGVWGFDSAELATGVHTLGIVHPPGYPLYLLLGKLFASLVPVGDLAYRLNLMSAFWAALSLLFVHASLELLTGNRLAAWVGAGFLAVSNQFWQMAIVAEVYTLHIFFLALNLWLVLQWRRSGERRWLFAFAFCFGLSLANHTSGILFMPGLAWLALSLPAQRRGGWKTWLVAGLLFTAGLMPYLYLPLRALAAPKLDYVNSLYGIDLTTLAGLWWMVSGQAYRFFAFGYPFSEILTETGHFISLAWRNMLGAGVLLAGFGLVWKWRTRWRVNLGLCLIFLGNSFFFINYRVLDKDTMFLPAYLVLALWAGIAVPPLLTWLAGAFKGASALQGLARNAVSLCLVLAVALGAGMNYRWLDMSSQTSRQAAVMAVLESASPDATVIAQWSSAVILEYTQTVEGTRPDIRIINRSRQDVALYYAFWSQGMAAEEIDQRIAAFNLALVGDEIQQHTVYILEYDPLYLNGFEYMPEGNYFQLARLEGEP
jgi:4-amino-4-deoxy-L-arabinose transferase-like glycosyltransferase